MCKDEETRIKASESSHKDLDSGNKEEMKQIIESQQLTISLNIEYSVY